MQSKERMFNMFSDRPVDRLPAQPICMTFAARTAGVDYYSYATDYSVLAEAQIRMVETYDLDIVTLCSDPCRESADCGAPTEWFPDQPPAHNPQNSLLKDKRDLIHLTPPDPLGGGRMHDRVKGAALLREKVGDDIPILGWIEGPIAEAADLRGINEIMVDLIDDPAFVHDLFSFILEMELNFARAQIDAGIDIIGIGDAAASLVGPDLYRTLIYPYQKQMVGSLHDMGCPVRLHICGNTTHLLTDMGKLGVEMVDIDSLADIDLARKRMGPDVTILGNIDPVQDLLEGTLEKVFDGLAECHRVVGDRYIVGPGCEVPPFSPPENVRVVVDYAKAQTDDANPSHVAIN